MQDTEDIYTQFPSVEGHWKSEDWQYVFENKHGASAPIWEIASPPPATPVAPFGPEDVAKVLHMWSESYKDYADQSMKAVVELKDGRLASVETWSDSSGYGCQDGTRWKVSDSLDDLIRWGLSDEARVYLNLEVSD